MEITIPDQMGSIIRLRAAPERIISLVPSQTELLADLGLDTQVVGITKFCVHPESWHHSKTRIGGTKQFSFDIIDSLRPDLVIGNKEENYKEGIDRLKEKYPVWLSDVVTLDDAYRMIESIGTLVDRQEISLDIIRRTRSAFSTLKSRKPKRVVYLIWRDPWMAVGPGTFINEMIQKIGWINCIDKERYPELTIDQLIALEPDAVLLSSEPFPFKAVHAKELASRIPRSKVLHVDGEMFSWYGSRLLLALEYFNNVEL